MLFLVSNGNLTLLFFYKGVNSIRADESSPLVIFSTKGNLILLFFTKSEFLFVGHVLEETGLFKFVFVNFYNKVRVGR